MTTKTSDIDMFAPVTLGPLTIANRFVRSATWEAMAGEDGTVTPKLTETLVKLAKGGVGLVIAGHAYVLKQGQAGPWKLGVHDPAMGPGLTGLTKAVHEAGGKIAAQLAHAGIKAHTGLSRMDAVGPSDGEGFRAMTEAEIEAAVEAFAKAAQLCRESGFDAVQIHAAHGYLLSQFLSPHYNKRTDAYGGSVEKRAHFFLSVLRRIRLAVGPKFPVLCKMNSEDFLPDGFTLDDALKVAELLKEEGLDILELSGGTGDSGKMSPVRPGKVKIPEGEAYFEDAARWIRSSVDIPLILVGGIRSLETAQRLVAEDVCDAVSMSRPLIREPGLVNRWKAGDLRPACCLSDNMCFKPAMAGEGISCLTETLEAKKTHPPKTRAQARWLAEEEE